MSVAEPFRPTHTLVSTTRAGVLAMLVEPGLVRLPSGDTLRVSDAELAPIRRDADGRIVLPPARPRLALKRKAELKAHAGALAERALAVEVKPPPPPKTDEKTSPSEDFSQTTVTTVTTVTPTPPEGVEVKAQRVKAPQFNERPALLADLAARFPVIAEFKPLALGIYKQIRAAVDVKSRQLRWALALHCRCRAYRANLEAPDSRRFNLDGSDAGEVSPEHRLPLSAPPPPPTPCTEDLIPMPAKIELTVKFSELPQTAVAAKGVKFAVEDGDTRVVIVLPSKAWKKVEQAAKDWADHWIAAVTGKVAIVAGRIELINPGVQVFEKKPKLAETQSIN